MSHPKGSASSSDDSTRADDSTKPDDSVRPGDSTPADDSVPTVDDSTAADDSSITSGEIDWTLLDSTNGPKSYQWAACYLDDKSPCDTKEPCCGIEAGFANTQSELNSFYAELLPGVEYVPSVDFSIYSVVWSYLFCCTTHGPWIVVDDVTRAGRTVELTAHVERWDLAPQALGRPFAVVQIPKGDYDGVVATIADEKP